jgi:diadenosine tetraphosphatase ApaH/serine/threonine PP2A family protein phosphatase
VRRLILSDIHANIEALEAVLADASGRYDTIVCCGDLVGYGGSPEEVIRWAQSAGLWIVRGNHDRACCGLEDPDWFNSDAQHAIAWTMEQLDREQTSWLAGLPCGPLCDGLCELAHGSPGDEDAYLIDRFDAQVVVRLLERPICFVGHTHLQGGWSWRQGLLRPLPPPGLESCERSIALHPGEAYLINPGSVGQPRDRDPRAAYALWDEDEQTLAFRRVPYDIASAQRRIRDAGLPTWLYERLAAGR